MALTAPATAPARALTPTALAALRIERPFRLDDPAFLDPFWDFPALREAVRVDVLLRLRPELRALPDLPRDDDLLRVADDLFVPGI